MDEHTQHEIEQTMRSIDGIERATPRPFFATRAEARLDRYQTVSKRLNWAFRPLTMILTMGLLMLLNILMVSLFQQELATHDATPTADQFAADWQLNDPLLSW